MPAIRATYLLHAFRDLLWPRCCLACGARTTDPIMCEACLDRSKAAPEPAPGADDDPIRPAAALWEFDATAPVRPVLHRLKYGNCPWIGSHLGRMLAEARLDVLGLPWDLVIAVPLHRKRQLERGYNQAEWIACGLADRLHIPVARKALIRSRPTETQTNLARARRRANVEGAFALGGVDLSDRRILLIDDTLTTGSTLGAAAGAIVDGGASCVQPLAVARAALRMEQEHAGLGSVISEQPDGFLNESSFRGHYL